MNYIELKIWLHTNVINGNIAYIITKNIKPFIYQHSNFLLSDIKLKQRVWHIMNDTKDIPLCKTCKLKQANFDDRYFRYTNYCSRQCMSNNLDVINKRKETCMIKYGGITPSYNAEVKEKMKNTILEKYNDHHYMNDINIKEKMIKNSLKKYGVDHPLKSNIIREKIKNTNIEKYGVDHAAESIIIREKMKNTNIERYGVENSFASEIVKEKIKNTNIKKYGVDNCQKNTEVRLKANKTKLEKYGYEYFAGLYYYKDYTLPSGKIIKIQGYENKALDILLKKYNESNLIIGSSNIVKYLGFNIDYTDFKNKTRYYFPDIYIISENKIIEVKSEWTYNKLGKVEETKNANLLKKTGIIR